MVIIIYINIIIIKREERMIINKSQGKSITNRNMKIITKL